MNPSDIKDPDLLERYIEFLVYYQGIRMLELTSQSDKITDPIILEDRKNGPGRLEDIFRRQNHLTKYELGGIRGLPFPEQVKFILFYRQHWSPSIMDYFDTMGIPFDKEGLLWVQKKHPSTYIYTGIMWPFIHTREGKTREDNILDHYKMVEENYEQTVQLIQLMKKPKGVIHHLLDSYPLLGPFRVYEVFTSLCYLYPQFPFTSNDYLFIGPGSKSIAERIFGHSPTLQEMCDLKDHILCRLMDLEQLGLFDFNGNPFDIKAMEDGFCEFRKYESMKVKHGRVIDKISRVRAHLPRYTKQTVNFWSLEWPF